MRRRELFPPDRGLQVRMVLAGLLTPVVVLAALALAVTLLSPKRLFMLGLIVVTGVVVAGVIGHLGRLGTSALSRYRELTADAGAARLTGNPSALASALMKVSGELGRFPAEDLRAAATRNAFNLMPAEAERWPCSR